VINYDRGEVVDAKARRALQSGSAVWVHRRGFVQGCQTGALSGPMVLPRDGGAAPGQDELLPHAAADTEHLSRVEALSRQWTRFLI
jgi:hypothetical protein